MRHVASHLRLVSAPLKSWRRALCRIARVTRKKCYSRETGVRAACVMRHVASRLRLVSSMRECGPSHRVHLAETWLTVYRQHSVISQPAGFLKVPLGLFSPFQFFDLACSLAPPIRFEQTQFLYTQWVSGFRLACRWSPMDNFCSQKKAAEFQTCVDKKSTFLRITKNVVCHEGSGNLNISRTFSKNSELVKCEIGACGQKLHVPRIIALYSTSEPAPRLMLHCTCNKQDYR
jgi:hypothetical protein